MLIYQNSETASTKEMTERAMRILDANYKKADLKEIVSQSKHIDNEQKQALLKLLKKYEHLFDGTLGDFKTEPVSIELKEGSEPYHGKAYPIPQIYEKTLKKEVERLCKLGVLTKSAGSPWGAPTFIIPKKNKTVRFITDLREVNKRIIRKPFPIPKIGDIMQKLEGFQWATALDLNMGYYTIRVHPSSQKILTLILPWVKYQYKRLPMGLANSPDIFQEKMSTLMADLEFARTYLDDLLNLTKSTYDDHLIKLELMLQCLSNAGLKVNAEKSTFCATEIEYLGYMITRKGIRPLASKVDAILKLTAPQNVRELRRFLGMVQYYRDLWQHRSHVLAPLTDLVGECGKTKGKKKKAIKPWHWEEQHQKAFIEIKAIISRDIMLTFPDFSKTFEIHTDASKRQLGSVIAQDNKPLAFFSRKLTKPQQNYTVTELELLSIVETLKEFRNILLGHKIKIYTDHKNLEYDSKNMESQRALRWRLLIEEFNPEFKYIKGEKNVVADALSRMDKGSTDMVNNQVLAMNSIDEQCFPIDSQTIAKQKLRDTKLKDKMRKNPSRFSKRFVQGHELILEDGKMYIPRKSRERVVNWYHHYLCHPGETRLEKTLREIMTWPGLSSMVRQYCKKCQACQMAKHLRRKYGKVPPKLAEDTPWKIVCVDTIGPYTVKQKNNLDANGKPKELTFSCLTMIDPATLWFEWAVITKEDNSSARMSQLFNNTWL